MASGIPAHAIAGLTHESGTPRYEFMLRANAEYRARGGTDGGHIGAIAEAPLTLAG